MKKDTKKWMWVIIGVIVLLVAAIFITASITGNVIRVPSSFATTQADVYTKAEVDSIVKNFATNSGILTMLSKCTVVNVGVPGKAGIIQTGNYVCSLSGKKCVSNFIGFDPKVTISGNTNKISQPIACGDATNNYYNASWARTVCC